MKRYRITATVRVYVMCDYWVEAESETEAREKALPADTDNEWATDLWQKGDWNTAEIQWSEVENLTIDQIEELGSCLK